MKVWKNLLCGLLLVAPAWANESDDRQTATSLKYVTTELDTRQDKLSAGADKAIEYTDSAGNVQQRTVEANLNGANDSLPTVSAVTDGLSHKQDSIAPIDDHTAVTYTGQVGGIGAKGIYQPSGTYAEQSDNLIDAKTFNAALKNGLDSEFVCSNNRQPGTNECWLWEIHNTGVGTNMFNKNDSQMIYSGYMQNKPVGQETSLRGYDGGDKVLFVKCEPNTTYIVRRKTGISNVYDRIRVCAFATDTIPVDGNRCIVLVNDMNTTQASATFTTRADTTWCGINVRNSGAVGTDWQTYLDNFYVTTEQNTYIPQNR